jgi:hypothetical protein
MSRTAVLEEVSDGMQIFLGPNQEQCYTLGDIGLLFERVPKCLWEDIEVASLAVSVLDTVRAREVQGGGCNTILSKSSHAIKNALDKAKPQFQNNQGPPDEELKTFDMAAFGIIRLFEFGKNTICKSCQISRCKETAESVDRNDFVDCLRASKWFISFAQNLIWQFIHHNFHKLQL